MSRLKAQANSAKHNACIRKSGYIKNGAITSAATITRKAMGSDSKRVFLSVSAAGSTLCNISGPPSEQSGGADQQNNRHDDKDHSARSFGKKNLGQTFDDAEPEAGDDRAHDRAH